jgi:hypothetical protein
MICPQCHFVTCSKCERPWHRDTPCQDALGPVREAEEKATTATVSTCSKCGQE